jgi:hypothetical protein
MTGLMIAGRAADGAANDSAPHGRRRTRVVVAR